MVGGGSGLRRGSAAQPSQRRCALEAGKATDAERRRGCANRSPGHSSAGEGLDSSRATSSRGSSRSGQNPGDHRGTHALRYGGIRRPKAPRIRLGGGRPPEPTAAGRGRGGLRARLRKARAAPNPPPACRVPSTSDHPLTPGGRLHSLLSRASPPDAFLQHNRARLRGRRPLAATTPRGRARQLGIPPAPGSLRARPRPRRCPPGGGLPNHPHHRSPHEQRSAYARERASRAAAARYSGLRDEACERRWL
jgi:hypothetical protein